MANQRGPTLPGQAKHPVVGIGASAGELSALLEFFEALPAHTSMAFVVVAPLAPDYVGNLPERLQKVTTMPVLPVTHSTAIEPDHIYLIAPSLGLTMIDDDLWVEPNRPGEGRCAAIDLFFRTLAEARRERAIGIMLSGAGPDGFAGLACVKEMGGITFAQAPDEAGDDSTPRSAISPGVVDFVLPAAEMPHRLLDLWLTTEAIRLPDREPDAPEQTLANEAAGSLHGLRMLMVDDDEGTVETFKLLLESEGATVETATSAEQALKMLDGNAPDVVLSDLGMPGMDGIEFVERLRREPAMKSVICIALSGYGQKEEIRRAEDAGFNAHLIKPVLLDDLIGVVGRLRQG